MITDIPSAASKTQAMAADKDMVVTRVRMENAGPVLKALYCQDGRANLKAAKPCARVAASYLDAKQLRLDGILGTLTRPVLRDKCTWNCKR